MTFAVHLLFKTVAKAKPNCASRTKDRKTKFAPSVRWFATAGRRRLLWMIWQRRPALRFGCLSRCGLACRLRSDLRRCYEVTTEIEEATRSLPLSVLTSL